MRETAPKALLFDIQGTVTDFFTTILTELRDLCAVRGVEIDGSRFVNDWRRAYSERVAGRDPSGGWQPVHEVYRTALDELLITYDATLFDDSEREQLTSAWQRLIPWPDTVPGLSALREHYTIAALSNADVAAVVRISKRANLPWDAIFTAEMSGAFKPAPRTYLMAAHYLGLDPADIMMVASHKYDIRAAAELGFHTAFIARPLEFGPDEHPDIAYDDAFDINAASILELAAILERSMSR
ncbi:haloacid dehalogenase type II [Nocardia sp. NPDC058058]|uniref:haloacid dehalogenase type II n=1 Tax=Nocardia sp. NPDC058058 TaxID=3346317 RepID=UPI0036DE4B25